MQIYLTKIINKKWDVRTPKLQYDFSYYNFSISIIQKD